MVPPTNRVVTCSGRADTTKGLPQEAPERGSGLYFCLPNPGVVPGVSVDIIITRELDIIVSEGGDAFISGGI